MVQVFIIQIFMAQFFNLKKEEGEVEKVYYGISTIVKITESVYPSKESITEIYFAGEKGPILVQESLDDVIDLFKKDAFLIQLTEKVYIHEF